MASPNEMKFRELVMPHFDAGYNLARWLTGNEADASDVLQDACVKSFRFIDSLESGHVKPWFLQIVRNTAFTFLRSRKLFSEVEADVEDPTDNAEVLVIRECEAKELRAAIQNLPIHHREILILREFEEMKYEDIATILGIPIGTVMSRLSRAHQQLKMLLKKEGESL